MSPHAVETVQARFHRYVAALFAVTFPVLALLEATISNHDTGMEAFWVGCAVLISIWAVLLLRRTRIDAMPMVLAAAILIGSISIAESLLASDRASVDVASTFGGLLVLGVLLGTLSAGSRHVWSVAYGLTFATWIVAVGILHGDPADRIGIRAVVALAGVVFTSALVSKLLDELAEAIERHDRAVLLQNAIATCSEALLVQTDKFAIHEALKALLEAGGPDYAYVDRTIVDGDTVGWEIIAEAHRRVTGVPSDWDSGVYDPDSEMYQRLSTGRAVTIHTKDLKGDELLEYLKDGIVSEASVPIFVGGVFRGSIGFISYTEPQEWSSDQMNTLWRASHMVSAYWKRQDDKEELRSSNESKDRLLASVSHEIRTPLTAIVGLSEEIVSRRHEMSDLELDELSGIIATQSRDLADLVEDLLVGARAESGDLSISPVWIDLKDEVGTVVRGVRESNPSSKLIAVSGDNVAAWADPLRCRQVIRNLLTNAIKYGGDRVAVIVRQVDDFAQVLVVDDGAGVKEHEAELIFERYYRSHETAGQPGSVGIGLAVSRQLAELMGGTLGYVTTAGNSRFEFAVPANPPQPPVGLDQMVVEATAAFT